MTRPPSTPTWSYDIRPGPLWFAAVSRFLIAGLVGFAGFASRHEFDEGYANAGLIFFMACFCVWALLTGYKIARLARAAGSDPLTTVVVDASGVRLAAISGDGSIPGYAAWPASDVAGLSIEKRPRRDRDEGAFDLKLDLKPRAGDPRFVDLAGRPLDPADARRAARTGTRFARYLLHGSGSLDAEKEAAAARRALNCAAPKPRG